MCLYLHHKVNGGSFFYGFFVVIPPGYCQQFFNLFRREPIFDMFSGISAYNFIGIHVFDNMSLVG